MSETSFCSCHHQSSWETDRTERLSLEVCIGEEKAAQGTRASSDGVGSEDTRTYIPSPATVPVRGAWSTASSPAGQRRMSCGSTHGAESANNVAASASAAAGGRGRIAPMCYVLVGLSAMRPRTLTRYGLTALDLPAESVEHANFYSEYFARTHLCPWAVWAVH